VKDFFDLADLTTVEIRQLLELSKELETNSHARALEGKVLALLFLNPSLRTLTSMQASMTRLGGGTFVVSPEMSIHGLETRAGIVMDGSAAEHIREAVPVIASYADVVGIRALASRENLGTDLKDSVFEELKSMCDIPLINLESAIKHPCQALSDWKTLNDIGIPETGGKLVFTWVYHPEALPLAVPVDTIYMAARRGMDVTLLRPDEFAMPDEIIKRTKLATEEGGGKMTETSNRSEAMENTHILYAGSWSSTTDYGNRIADQKQRNKYQDWCVDETWFDHAAESCKFMHCLPVRRGVEVEDDVLDSARSVVIQQARNRMYLQMSVLKSLVSGVGN